MTRNIKNGITIYRGIYECTDINNNITFNGKVALSNINDVIFMDNIETISSVPIDSTLFILPEECRPYKRTRLYVSISVKTTPTTNVNSVIDILTTGEVINRTDWTNSNLIDIYLYGHSFNNSGKYYGA